MYKKIHSLFRTILIEFILVVFSIGALQTVDVIGSNEVFQIITMGLICINLATCVLFLLFYLIAGIILLCKVIIREKMPFVKSKLLEMAVMWAIISVIACILKCKPTTYIGMIIWCLVFTFSDIIKNEMSRLDEARANINK